MVGLKELSDVFESFSPLDYQWERDNTGWNIYQDREVTGVFVCLDVTDRIIDLAEEHGCSVILSHHPLLFYPIKCITDQNSTGLFASRIIRNGMSLFCAHTSVDAAPWGINGYLADVIGLNNRVFIDPDESGNYGMGYIGDAEFDNAFAVADILKSSLGLDSVRITGNADNRVGRIALCAGAAGDLCQTARIMGADVFITGEMKHNYYIENNDTVIIEAGHYGTESCFCRLALDYLQKMSVGLKYNLNLFIDEYGKSPYSDY